jgi:hypothetical protein
VILLRGQDRDALDPFRIRHTPRHREALRDVVERCLERRPIDGQRREIEAEALEEHLRATVAVVVLVDDRRAMAVQDLRECRHDSLPVRSLDEQRADLRGSSAHRRRARA